MIKNEEIIKVDDLKNKSEFERKIIECFKHPKIIDSYESLSQAYQELPKYIEQIKSTKSFLLNSNIIDKINRLLKRNYININILISKILYTLLDASNFPILSDDSSILINFSNSCINIVDIISLHNFSYNLTKRVITFLKYLENNSKKYLDSEQFEVLKKIQKNLKERITNHYYNTFKLCYEYDIISYFSKEGLREREKGLFNLNSYFFKFSTLNEQFDLLCEYGHLILNSIINQPNPAYIELYYKTADFIISFIFNFFYVIKIGNNYQTNINNFFLCDNMDLNLTDIQQLKLDNLENIKKPENLNFLENKIFELDEQKDFLLNYTNIFSLCTTIVNCLVIYESAFNCQFSAYLILKRLYFIFPKYRNKIEDMLTTTLVNLVSFKSDIIKNRNEQCELFLKYLLRNGEQELKEKLITRLNSQKAKIEKNYLDENIINNNIEKEDVETDIIYLNDFNLRVGCPMNLEIKAGDVVEKLIEVRYPNSIIYIGFNTVGFDINFHLVKFCPNLENEFKDLENKQFEQQKYFYEIFKIEKSEGGKIVLFAKNPGIYKVIFDNKYSWFNYKLIRYRISILKEMIKNNGTNKKDYKNETIINNEEMKNDNSVEIINSEKDSKIDVK